MINLNGNNQQTKRMNPKNKPHHIQLNNSQHAFGEEDLTHSQEAEEMFPENQQNGDRQNDNNRVQDPLLVAPLEEFEFSDTDLDDETMKYLKDPEERIVLADIQKGSVYAIDHKKLPPTTPKVLQESVRVVLVTDKSEKSITMRYPTETWEECAGYKGSSDPLPKIDRLEMDSELAVKVLAKRIPVDELNRKAFCKEFWFLECLQTEKVCPSVIEIDSDSEEDCECKDLCVGRKLGKNEIKVESIDKFEENVDEGFYISNSSSDVEVAKLNYDCTGQGKVERLVFCDNEMKNGYQVCHAFDADKVKEEVQREKDECVEKVEESDDGDEYISDSPSEIKEAKLELKEFSTGNSTRNEKLRQSKYLEDQLKNRYQVSLDFGAIKAEEEIQREKDENFNAVPTRYRKRMKTRADSQPSKAQKLPSGKKRADRTKASTKKVDPDIGRWSHARYEKARAELLAVMMSKKAVFGNAIRRQDLREEALKRIGDTGLLDHLLKHAKDKVAPDGAHRFRRWYDRDGIMEFWLESADLDDLRNELGIQDPFWIPPAGWKKPGDSSNVKKSICAATIKVLKEDLAKEMRKMRSLAAQGDDDLVGALNLGICSLNPTALKETYAELKKERSELSETMKRIEALLSTARGRSVRK